MAAVSRTVRRLRLRASSESVVQRAALVVEDALRTASLPDAGARMLFVRHVALGGIDLTAPSTAVALSLERALAAAATSWRHGGDPAAGAASAVWFRDPLDAHIALAERLLSGPAPTEWFWPLAVPKWQCGASRDQAVRSVAFSVAACDEAPIALPQWFSTLVRAGHAHALAAALHVDDPVPLARAAGVAFELGEPGIATAPPAAASGSTGSGTEQVLRLGAFAPSRRGEPMVLAFIVAMLRAAGMAAPWADRTVKEARPVQGRVLMQEPMGELPAGHDSSSLHNTTEQFRSNEVSLAANGSAAVTASPRWPGVPDVSARAPVPARRSGPQEQPLSPGALRGHGLDEICAHPAPELVSTAAGGLLFLLNALARIGYARWLAEQPAWAPHEVARRVLARVLARLEVAAMDPAWRLFKPSAMPTRCPPRFIAPACWREGLLSGDRPLRVSGHVDAGRLYDGSRRLLLGAWRGPRPRSLLGDCRRAIVVAATPGRLDDEVVEAWLVALRRWLRRFAHMGLTELVIRPGGIIVTHTHVDVEFALDDVELRVRRAGLDVDPAWLAWFGRVVAFHYEPAAQV